MRKYLILCGLIFIACGLTILSACGGGDSSGATGSLIADFDLEGEEYLAVPDSPIERLCLLFREPAAEALPNLGFNSNCFPFNQFAGTRHVQEGLEVVISAADMTFIAQGTIDSTGRVSFTDLPTGYLMLNVTGSEGNTYRVPVQVSEGVTSHAMVLVYRNVGTGNVLVTSKTIHDPGLDGVNDDIFSYALFARPRNQAIGGVVHLHLYNETLIDANGDGDFLDADDDTIIEPDDDGVASDAGDGDEDNDGLLDNVDDDIDGDDIPNASDPDIDGDGLANADDPYPDGITPQDDFNPPGMMGSLLFSGVKELALLDEHTVTVFFPVALDDKHEPVTYNIYYSTTSPIDFATASRQRFRPLGEVSPDQILSDNVTGLVTGQTYFFVVRSQDSAQPPNEDTNTTELSIEVKPKD